MSDPPRLATGAFRYELPRTGAALDLDGYRGPTWWPLIRPGEFSANRGMRRIVLLWLLVNATAVLTGVLNVALGWNGIEVRLGVLRFDVTIFPPLVLSLLCAIWLGPTWGIVPAYLGKLASALWSGIAWPTSVLFALAGAIETFIFWGSMVTLNISPDLRRGRDLGRLLAVALIAPITSSLAVVIWNTALGLDFLTGQRTWRGWVIGDFLQTVLVVAPLLRFLGPSARSWIDRQFASSPRSEVTYTRTALLAFLVFVLMGVLVFVGIGMLQNSLGVGPAMRTESGELLRPRLFEIQFFLGLLVAALILATGVFSTALARMSERQRGLARRESLTGCFNRRAFYELFPRESDRSRRLGQGIAVVFLDVDHFKGINDRLGHEMGDRVLQQLALRVQGVIRETDLLFRWGGRGVRGPPLPHRARRRLFARRARAGGDRGPAVPRERDDAGRHRHREPGHLGDDHVSGGPRRSPHPRGRRLLSGQGAGSQPRGGGGAGARRRTDRGRRELISSKPEPRLPPAGGCGSARVPRLPARSTPRGTARLSP